MTWRRSEAWRQRAGNRAAHTLGSMSTSTLLAVHAGEAAPSERLRCRKKAC